MQLRSQGLHPLLDVVKRLAGVVDLEDLSLDDISRVLADLKQDSSQLIDDLISAYPLSRLPLCATGIAEDS